MASPSGGKPPPLHSSRRHETPCCAAWLLGGAGDQRTKAPQPKVVAAAEVVSLRQCLDACVQTDPLEDKARGDELQASPTRTIPDQAVFDELKAQAEEYEFLRQRLAVAECAAEDARQESARQ